LTTMILVSLPTQPRQPQTFCFAAIGRLENKFIATTPADLVNRQTFGNSPCS
jgi:hypothetical protein